MGWGAPLGWGKEPTAMFVFLVLILKQNHSHSEDCIDPGYPTATHCAQGVLVVVSYLFDKNSRVLSVFFAFIFI